MVCRVLRPITICTALLLPAWNYAHAVKFICEEVKDSDIACDFVIVEVIQSDSQSPVEARLDPQLKYVEDFLVLGSETREVPDTYLNKLYCPALTSAFRDTLPPGSAVDRAPVKPSTDQILKACLIPLLTTVKAVNNLGYFGPTHVIVPPEFAQKQVADRIEKCVLLSSEMANRPYDYGADQLPVWYVGLKPGGKWAFGANSELVTDQESEVLTSACHQKWFSQHGDGAELKISDFIAPTYLGWEQERVKNHNDIKRAIDDLVIAEKGYVLHFKTVSKWYVSYSELFWEAKVTKSQDENSDPVEADALSIRWRYLDPVLSLGQSGIQVCGKSSYCSHSERLYVYPYMIPLKLCGNATAKTLDVVAQGILPKGDDCWHQ